MNRLGAETVTAWSLETGDGSFIERLNEQISKPGSGRVIHGADNDNSEIASEPSGRQPPLADGGVLVVEDDYLVALACCSSLNAMNLAVCATADTAEDAVALALVHRPGLVLMDVRLKGRKDGVDAAREIQRLLDCPIVFLTGARDHGTAKRIAALNPPAMLLKPFRPEQFRDAIISAIPAHRESARLAPSQPQGDG